MKAIHDFVYPHCCICCGESIENYDFYICDFCSLSRFESALNNNLIMPESVIDVISLWKFDKGGYLQEILHQLKYNRIEGAGIHLGKLLGMKLIQFFPEIGIEGILIPVPLHRSKERQRGFNQARSIAEGVSDQVKRPVIKKGNILRTKRTKTQTGLHTEERSSNLSNAFTADLNGDLKSRIPVIVDDVFTTGTTTFELAKEIYNRAGRRCYIATVAQA